MCQLGHNKNGEQHTEMAGSATPAVWLLDEPVTVGEGMEDKDYGMIHGVAETTAKGHCN